MARRGFVAKGSIYVPAGTTSVYTCPNGKIAKVEITKLITCKKLVVGNFVLEPPANASLRIPINTALTGDNESLGFYGLGCQYNRLVGLELDNPTQVCYTLMPRYLYLTAGEQIIFTPGYQACYYAMLIIEQS